MLLPSIFTNRFIMANFVRRDAVVWFSGSASQVTLVVENPPASAGDIRDTGLIPGSGRSPGGGHDHQLQHSCLENCMDRGAWSAPMNGVEESWMWLTTHTHSKNLWRTVVLSKMLERRNRNFFGHSGSKNRLINMSQLENKWMLKWDMLKTAALPVLKRKWWLCALECLSETWDLLMSGI